MGGGVTVLTIEIISRRWNTRDGKGDSAFLCFSGDVNCASLLDQYFCPLFCLWIYRKQLGIDLYLRQLSCEVGWLSHVTRFFRLIRVEIEAQSHECVEKRKQRLVK